MLQRFVLSLNFTLSPVCSTHPKVIKWEQDVYDYASDFELYCFSLITHFIFHIFCYRSYYRYLYFCCCISTLTPVKEKYSIKLCFDYTGHIIKIHINSVDTVQKYLHQIQSWFHCSFLKGPITCYHYFFKPASIFLATRGHHTKPWGTVWRQWWTLRPCGCCVYMII